MFCLASRDQTIRRWTFRGLQSLDVIDTIGSPIRHMVISSDDTFIVVACQDMTVQVKSLVTGSDIHHLEGHTSEVSEQIIYEPMITNPIFIFHFHIRSPVLLFQMIQYSAMLVAIIHMFMSTIFDLVYFYVF